MYSLLKVSYNYIRYFFSASNAKGHGVHSPFVFSFITNVLNDRRRFDAYNNIELLRNQLLSNQTQLTIQDFGAGSGLAKSNQRKVNAIARSALKAPKYGQLLFRMVNYYKPAVIVELGTSLGITTSYLASANAQSQVFTFEGAAEVAAVARENFKQFSLQNIQLIEGNFDFTLPQHLPNFATVDLAFIDGNHRKLPTLQYFEWLLSRASDQSIFIFDDIHWSAEMEEAWLQIQQHPSVTLTIDLFFIGIVFFRKEQKKVQHFSIRF